jgi:hypothetical protein
MTSGFVRAVALATMIAFAPPFLAAAQAEPRAEETLVHSALKLLEAFRRFIEDMPSFSPPEMTKDGDIILRRQPPEKTPTPKSAEKQGEAIGL